MLPSVHRAVQHTGLWPVCGMQHLVIRLAMVTCAVARARQTGGTVGLMDPRNRKIPEVTQVPGIPELDEADNDVAEHLFGWEQRLRLEMNVSDFVWFVPQNTLAGIDDIQGRKIIHVDISRPMVAFWSDRPAQ